LSGAFKFGMHEKVMRHAYIEFVREHPVFMTQLMLFWKPVRAVSTIGRGLLPQVRADLKSPVLAGLFVLLVAVCALWVTTSSASGRDTRVLAGTLLVGIPALMLPIWWAFPARHVIGEQMLMTATVVVFALIWLVAAIWGRTPLRRRLYPVVGPRQNGC